MNSIRQVQALNKRELEHAIPPEASWHADYRDTAYIYIGGLPFDLSEGDIIAIFSQYGEPVHVNLIRDKETGKSKGFAFLKYEDQRSTDLAVDNLGGATVMGRLLRVDHARYKRKDDEEEQDNVAKLMGDPAISENTKAKEDRREIEERRPVLKEEKELEELIRTHDEEDPMKEFLIEEKKEEVATAIQLWNSTKKSSRRRDDSRERSSRRHRRHRSRSPRERRHRDDRSPDKERRSRYRSSERGEKSRRDRSPRKSRSPESRRHRSDRERHDRRR
ncbi:Nucleotide-binding alpha-beta plait [Penicillium hordei]|uniref:Nucleotide-binding alpha-beta plait n=1 Tax=Penicillium hordei TaxID=40994 RepID=A0AAD6E6F4_9EURO|nr:Nucleotide-binding alpha-beta plait [Penicillium hordei]KAJ5602909.1 Nucleotide-binding alpha-beta plait [Penicillium hordei]